MKRTFTIFRSYFLVLTCIVVTSYLHSQTAYITNQGDNTVSIINTVNNTVIKTISVDQGPTAVSVSGNGSRVYITNADNSNISVINTSDNTVIKIIMVGSSPSGISVNGDGSRVYVTNFGESSVSVINTFDNMVIKTIVVGSSPAGISVNGDGSRVYVVNSDDNSVSVINTLDNTVIKTIVVGDRPISFGNFISSYKQPTAVVNIENTDIEVYPNPTNGQINFSNIQADKIEVYDNIGKLILSEDKPGNSIDISDSPSGLYNIKIQVASKTYSAKIIKK